MVRLFVVACLVTLWFAGCLEEGAPAAVPPAEAPSAVIAPEPHKVVVAGQVPLAQTENLNHQRPAEDALWPLQQSGFLLDIPEKPAAFEVRLTWSATKDGQFLIMLHSHKAHGTNVYVEHITNWTSQKEVCLRVPAADLADGTWQVMIHTRDVALATWKLAATTWGVESKVNPDRHGHWPQDGAFQVDKHSIEECTGVA